MYQVGTNICATNNGRTPETIKVFRDGQNVAIYAADFCGGETQVVLTPDQARHLARTLKLASRLPGMRY